MVKLILSRKLLDVLAQGINFMLPFPCVEEGATRLKVENESSLRIKNH